MSLTLEQLEIRRHGITGSDAPAIVGMSTYRSPADVWIEKKHPEAVAAISDKQKLKYAVGHAVETAIATLYADQRKVKLIRVGTVPHPNIAWLLATPDSLAPESRTGLELKNVSEWQRKEWGPPGTDVVPKEHLIQCQHYMMVFGFAKWDVAALIGGQDFRIYHLYADKELQALLYEAEKSFYTDFIIGDKEPKFDSGEQVRKYVLSKYPNHEKDKTIEVDPYDRPDVKQAIKTLCGVRRLIKQYKLQEEEQKTFLMNYMEDAAELRWVDEGICIRWKTPNPTIKVDWKGIADSALEKTTLLPEEITALKEAHTAKKENTRRFTVKDPNAKEDEDDE